MSHNHFGTSFELESFSLPPALLPVVVGWLERRKKGADNPNRSLARQGPVITYEVGIGFAPSFSRDRDMSPAGRDLGYMPTT